MERERPLDNYYTVTVERFEDSNDDAETIRGADLRDVLELLHLIQRPDNASRLHEAAKAVGYNPWELARLKEALADATEVLDGIMDQIDGLEREAEA